MSVLIEASWIPVPASVAHLLYVVLFTECLQWMKKSQPHRAVQLEKIRILTIALSGNSGHSVKLQQVVLS